MPIGIINREAAVSVERATPMSACMAEVQPAVDRYTISVVRRSHRTIVPSSDALAAKVGKSVEVPVAVSVGIMHKLRTAIRWK